MARLAVLACFFLVAPALAEQDDVSLMQLGAREVDHCSVADAKLLEKYQEENKNKYSTSAQPRALYSGPPQHEHIRNSVSLIQQHPQKLKAECEPDVVYTAGGKIKEEKMIGCFLANGATHGWAKCATEDSLWREKHCTSKCKDSFFSAECVQCPQEHAEELIICQTTSHGISEACGKCFSKTELWQTKHCAEPCQEYQFTGESREKCDKCNQDATDFSLACQGKSLSQMEIMVWNQNSKKFDDAMKEARRKAAEQEQE